MRKRKRRNKNEVVLAPSPRQTATVLEALARLLRQIADQLADIAKSLRR